MTDGPFLMFSKNVEADETYRPQKEAVSLGTSILLSVALYTHS
jgi:hypothetical protein